MSSPAYVLGAGFSRAINDAMPITDELGNEVLARDPTIRGNHEVAAFDRGSFESWLSRRAEDQPYLHASQNYASRAIYARAIELVAAILQEREAAAMATNCPEWLLNLLQGWHKESAIVITFNYDTLVESAIPIAGLYDAVNKIATPWATAINFTPTGAGTTIGEQGQSVSWKTFQLLKMHGSLNRYWPPDTVPVRKSRAHVSPADMEIPGR
jgi:hypothetical protein